MTLKLSEYLDRDLLKQEILDRHVSVQSHPTEPLNILNYTNQCQFDGAWNDVTKKTRGLIYNVDTEEIVARPFAKFFNHTEEHSKALDWSKPVRVQDKWDGSLGILYQEPDSGRMSIATRGSFTSEQALHATEVLRSRYEDFQPYEGYTYLFEIIYPQNRIVVDYGDMDDLVLLDVLDNETGHSVIGSVQEMFHWHGPFAEWWSYDSLFDVVESLVDEQSNAEGFVVYLKQSSERVKIKFEEYKRLHRLMTGVSNKTIWEMLSSNQPIESLLDVVPDEFYDWVRSTANNLCSEYDRLYSAVTKEFRHLVSWNITTAQMSEDYARERKKRFALAVKDSEYRDILFALYDDKDIAPLIWKRLKPSYSKPFWNQSEATA